MNHPPRENGEKIVIVGGGPAGVAAAVALVTSGRLRDAAGNCSVELFEATGRLGGRATSFVDRHSGVVLDTCQHVLMGCCTATIDLFRTVGLLDRFDVYDRYHFFDASGTRHDFAATRGLPAPLHLLPGFWRLKYLTRSDRLRILRSLMRLRKLTPSACAGRTIGDWLREEGHSDQACERFWGVVLVGALSETLDRASLAAARKVFVDGFLRSRDAYRLWVPREPIGTLFDQPVGAWLEKQGVLIHRNMPVRRLIVENSAVHAVETSDGRPHACDRVIVAIPWHRFDRLKTQSQAEIGPRSEPYFGSELHLENSPITAVHLWFDRPITTLPHAVLVDQRGNWMFRPPWAEPNYAQVVISESRAMLGLTGEVRDMMVRQIAEDLVRTVSGGISTGDRPRLVRHHTITHPRAVFSITPESDRCRPASGTALENLTLAGDWTSTGWPSTIEGAIRSGNTAVF